MRNLLKVVTVRGMPVRLHYTWLFIVLISLPLLTQYLLPQLLPAADGPARLAVAILILLAVLASVVLHEIGHMLAARLLHVRFPVMNLYPLGAITRLPDRYGRPAAAFWIAAAGPLASLLLAQICRTLASAGSLPPWLVAVLLISGQFNLYLGLCNILPAFPLDGGRMLRAGLHWLFGSAEMPARLSRTLGQVLAYGMVFLGAIRIIGAQDWMLGGALVLVGWMVREAGGSTHRRVLVVRLLNQLTAKDVLSQPRRQASPAQTLQDFMQAQRGRLGDEPTPVLTDGVFLGMIDRARVHAIPQGYWSTRTVAETMISASELPIVAPTAPVSMLLPHLASAARTTQPSIAVVQDGRLLGLVDADDLLAFLDLEDEFGLLQQSPLAPPPDAPLHEGEPEQRALHERAIGR